MNAIVKNLSGDSLNPKELEAFKDLYNFFIFLVLLFY